MNIDDATDEPINTCYGCGKEVVGYVDNPEDDFFCDSCKRCEEE